MKDFWKYLLTVLTVLLMTSAMAYAEEKVGILLEAPIEFCNDVNVHELIDNNTALLFPKDRCTVMSTADSIAATDTVDTANTADITNTLGTANTAKDASKLAYVYLNQKTVETP